MQNPPLKLSKYFSYREMTASQTATRFRIDNTPGAAQVLNMIALCTDVLDPIRELVGAPVHVSSGYRSVDLNRAVNGSRTSQHIRGQAADITVPGMSIAQLMDLIISSGIEFDQIIDEFGEWVHISYSDIKSKPNRRSILYARHNKQGRVVFLKNKP